MNEIGFEERFDLSPLVTFVPNKKYAIHNWFHFKEGFSKDFVFLMLDNFKIKRGQWVLDPFCGSGTALLTCKEFGVNAVGVDAMPLSVFISQVKTSDYNMEKLRTISRNIFSKRFVKPNVRVSSLVKRSFTKYALEDIFFFKDVIRQIEDPLEKNFFTFALMISSEKVSFAYKDGAVIKIWKKKNVPPFRPVFKRTVKKMFHDMKKFRNEGSKIEVFLGDARRLSFLESSTFDAIITSPPYLNIIDYAKVYKIENELFFGNENIESIRSYIGLNINQGFEESVGMDSPLVEKAYLKDIGDAISEQFRVLKKNGRVAMVVGEGVFPNRIVPVQKMLCDIAKGIGFKVEKIWYVNRRIVTDHRRQKVGSALESVLFFKK